MSIKAMAWNEPHKAIGIDFDSGDVFILLPQNADVSPEDMRKAENVLAETKGYLDGVPRPQKKNPARRTAGQGEKWVC